MPTVLWRLPKLALTSGVVASTHKKGKAQHWLVQGRVTTTAMTRKPQPRTTHRSFAAGERAIAVMSPFTDLGSPAPLQRFVDDQFQRATCLDEGFHDDGEQLTAHSQRRPARPVEHLVERAEVRLPLVAAMTQGGCNSATSMSQQGARQQDHQFPPCWSGKQWPKGGQNLYNGVRKGHDVSPLQDRCLITLYLTPEVASCPMLSPHCTKSSLGDMPMRGLLRSKF